MSLIKQYQNKLVEAVTNDGRIFIGTLIGYDNPSNIVLRECIERVFSKSGVSVIPCGLLVLRGDEIILIGALDEQKDSSVDWPSVIANPLAHALI
ncbi:lsm1, putative [Entamoeba invadens IP1]|uniref:U6 snRNA-associated Sm-like protein LSm8 n=1 Tax=Entamoeba invadens IP1 TaxID=370355 RepID=A0A0A1TV87_ENTIV|nr:lsm1, putative [Entamoeba invadens IP1]ELP84216.1 lsm1, putative [Entamoeba invadens IP1]|eukprot:XP_004183562.1 lsm1, putative [Entamoeba invadens IP1]